MTTPPAPSPRPDDARALAARGPAPRRRSSHLGFLLRQLGYDLEGSLLVRPAVFVAAHAALALLVTGFERRLGPEADPWREALFPAEMSTAQAVLGTLAGSMMTTISVVYSILLVALSLASVQYSPRILAGFVRDRVSRTTLGLFVGCFVYCLLVLRTVRGEPDPFVPSLGIALGLALALVSLGGLVYVIHHIVRSIQANTIVDRIAAETEEMLDRELGPPLGPGEVPSPPVRAITPEGAAAVPAPRSGYIQLVDVEGLAAVAAAGFEVRVARPVGGFVVGGTPIAWILPATAGTASVEAAVRGAFDIGALRTLQQDVEWGFRQIVDIALKAISPAVNDPSTAGTCIDHLGRLLVRAACRQPPRGRIEVGRGLVVLPTTCFVDLLDLAFEQIRQYGHADMAVCLRLLRTIGEVADVAQDPEARRTLARHARLVATAGRAAHGEEDCEELERRYTAVLAALAEAEERA